MTEPLSSRAWAAAVSLAGLVASTFLEGLARVEPMLHLVVERLLQLVPVCQTGVCLWLVSAGLSQRLFCVLLLLQSLLFSKRPTDNLLGFR